MKKNIILLLILVLAAVLRLTDIKINPPALNQDEAVSAYDAYCLGKTMHDHHGNFCPVVLQSFNDWTSPTVTYLSIPFIKVFGLNIFGTRFPVALLGIFTVWLLFLFLMEIGLEKSNALFGSFLLAIIPWHITATRWGHPFAIVPFFLILMLLLFLRAEKEQKPRKASLLYLLSGLTGVLLAYSYPAQKLFVPTLVIALSVIFLFRKWKNLAIFSLPFFVMIFPQYWLTYIDPAKYNSRFQWVSYLAKPHPFSEILSLFFTRYSSYLLPDFHFGSGDPDIMHQVPGMPISYSILCFFFYLGIGICIYYLFSKKDFFLSKKIILMLLGWFFLFPVAASMTNELNHIMRAVHGLPLVIIFTCISLQYLKNAMSEKLPAYFIQGLLVIYCAFSLVEFQHILFHKYPANNDVKTAFQFGIRQSMEYAIKHENEYDSVKVDGNINQPYIYYLFFSQYDPHKLFYKDGKAHNVETYGSIGKYLFRTMEDKELEGAKQVYEVNDDGKIWFRLFSKNNILFIKRAY